MLAINSLQAHYTANWILCQAFRAKNRIFYDFLRVKGRERIVLANGAREVKIIALLLYGLKIVYS